jgi:hypothetical protein
MIGAGERFGHEKNTTAISSKGHIQRCMGGIYGKHPGRSSLFFLLPVLGQGHPRRGQG